MAHPPAGFDAEKLARLRFAIRLRDALVARLEPGGDGTGLVWFDRKRLAPGDEWELAIVAALHRCEAAVLLLTPDALESPWVLREATVLGDRRGRWPGLRLVPVLCAGVTHETLARLPYWAALDLTRWQPVQAARGAYRGAPAGQDIRQIVDQVAAQLHDLGTPRDPAQERWTEDVRAFLADLAQRQLKTRLGGAAQVLRVKVPPDWDGTGIERLARALLQTDVAGTDEQGTEHRPLAEALGQLIPGDPLDTPFSEAEKKFCLRLQPLAAPPGAAVAVGAGAGVPGRPVLLQADNPRLAELAARRASCGEAWVRPLSGIVGEGPGPTADSIAVASKAVKMAALARARCYVVASFRPLAGDDLGALANDLAARLPPQAAIVGAVARGGPAAGAQGLVEVPAADEAAAVEMADYIDLVCGRA